MIFPKRKRKLAEMILYQTVRYRFKFDLFRFYHVSVVLEKIFDQKLSFTTFLDLKASDDESENETSGVESGQEPEISEPEPKKPSQTQNPKKKKGLKTKKGQTLVRASNKAEPTKQKVKKEKVKKSKDEDNAEKMETESENAEKVETSEQMESSEKIAEDSEKDLKKHVQKKQKGPHEKKKFEKNAEKKDKHWRDVSKMTDKQKAKYFKTRKIRKCIKVKPPFTYKNKKIIT